MSKTDNNFLATLFAAGVHSAASDAGLSEKSAESLVGKSLKVAASRRKWDDDEEEETWWDRNKTWLIPTMVGTGAFLVGADAGRNRRPDRGYLSNAGSLLWRRVKKLIGMSDDPLLKATTQAKEYDPYEEYNDLQTGSL